jgi:hypothetical protein
MQRNAIGQRLKPFAVRVQLQEDISAHPNHLARHLWWERYRPIIFLEYFVQVPVEPAKLPIYLP